MSYTDFDFPHSDFYRTDLRQLIADMKKLKKAMEVFKSAETLKFADPIQWNIATQYEKNTIVIDSSGNAYLSLQPVTSGVQLNNEDYWLEIFNFTDYTRTANKNLTVNTETNTTRATAAYQIDDWLIWNDILYKVTSAIAIDDALIVSPADGANLIHFTVEDFIKTFMAWTTATIAQYKSNIDASELAYRNQLAQDIANTTANLQAQLDAAIAGATIDSEVINARVAFDGVTYSTLGEAIRAQIEHIYDFADGVCDNYFKKITPARYGSAYISGDVGDTIDLVSSTTWRCAFTDCNENDLFRIDTVTYDVSKYAIAFTDENDEILELAALGTTNELTRTFYITAPAGAKKVFAAKHSATPTDVPDFYKLINHDIILSMFNKGDDIGEFLSSSSISGNIGETIAISSSSNWKTTKCVVKGNSDYLIETIAYGGTGTTGRYNVICTDSNDIIVSVNVLGATDNVDRVEYIHTPANAKYMYITKHTTISRSKAICYQQKKNNDTKISLLSFNCGKFNYTDGVTSESEYVQHWREMLISHTIDNVFIQDYSATFGTGSSLDSDVALFKDRLKKDLYPRLETGLTAANINGTIRFVKSFILDDNTELNRRTAFHFQVEKNGKVINVFNVHCSPTNSTDRATQFATLISEMQNYEYSIAIGDFNAATFNEYDPFTSAGLIIANGGYLAPINTLREEPADNCIFTSNIRLLRFDVLDNYNLSTDHFPIWCELSV